MVYFIWSAFLHLPPSFFFFLIFYFSYLQFNNIFCKYIFPWLGQEEAHWPIKELVKTKAADSELKKEALKAISLNAVKIDIIGIDKVVDASKFSNYGKLLRVTSLVFRFLQNCRVREGDRTRGVVSSAEMHAAEQIWVKNLQVSLKTMGNYEKISHSLGVFEDDMGVLRCGERLKKCGPSS